jgi:hypothetical protein
MAKNSLYAVFVIMMVTMFSEFGHAARQANKEYDTARGN